MVLNKFTKGRRWGDRYKDKSKYSEKEKTRRLQSMSRESDCLTCLMVMDMNLGSFLFES